MHDHMYFARARHGSSHLLGNLDLALGNQGASDGGTQEVHTLVLCVGPVSSGVATSMQVVREGQTIGL